MTDEQPTAQRFSTADETEREAGIANAALAVQRGQLVVLPTDTVYGIGADAFDPESVRRLLEAKGRGREMPPPVLVSAPTTLDALAVGVPSYARALITELWPGPLTLVCRQQPSLQWDLGDTRGTVAVRMPDHEVALELLARTGPLAVSSANRTGRPAATDADQAEEMLGSARRGDPRRRTHARGRALHHRRRHRARRPGAAAGGDLARAAQRDRGAARRRDLRRGLGHVREYLTVFLVAAVVTYLLGVVAREIALRTGAVARVRDRDVHAVPIPYFGGVAMLGGLAAAYLVAHRLPFLSLSDKQVFHDATFVLIGGAMICLLGVLDDLFELDALTKLGGQVLAAGFLVINQVQFFAIQLPGRGQFSLDSTQAALISVVVVVATVNAVNFVDGLDGLAAGVVGIGAVAFFVFAYKLADANDETLAISAALLCAALGGACAGFLPHNFFPARIFMGDSGSMLIGLVLAGSALEPDRPVRHRGHDPGRRRLAGQPAAHAAADHPADLDPGRAVRRPGAGRDPPDPGRPVAVLARTRSTCTTGCWRSATRTAARC